MAKKKSTIRTVFAENLRTAIEKSGMGVNRAADAAGVSRSQLYDALGGRKGASIDWIDMMASTLKVQPHTLLQP